MRYPIIYNRKITLKTLFLAFALTLGGGIPQTWADFDPVNDDTDIFLAITDNLEE